MACMMFRVRLRFFLWLLNYIELCAAQIDDCDVTLG
jgi:hypothetical protein